MRLSSFKVPLMCDCLSVLSSSRLSSILNQTYKGLVGILSLDFKFRYFPGGVVVGGWSGEIKIKA